MPKSAESFTFTHSVCFPAQELNWTVSLKHQPHWLPSQMRFDSAHLQYNCISSKQKYAMILHFPTQFAYAKRCLFFPVTFIFCFQKFYHSAFIIKPHLEDFSSFRVLPWQYANPELPHGCSASEFSQEHFKQDAEQIPENNLPSISVLYNQTIQWFSSEKLKTSEWSDDFCSICHASSSDLPRLYPIPKHALPTSHTVIYGCYT